jgi:dihydrofolate reductase
MNKPHIIIIAAMAENRVIGRDGAIPWSLKEDMWHFKALTMGFPCVMGRKTWESLPVKPLPGRLNAVVSASMYAAGTAAEKTAAGQVKVFPSLSGAVEFCGTYEKVFICGGGALYREALHVADTLELTLIHRVVEGDVFFPEIDDEKWAESGRTDHSDFSFITYSRR